MSTEAYLAPVNAHFKGKYELWALRSMSLGLVTKELQILRDSSSGYCQQYLIQRLLGGGLLDPVLRPLAKGRLGGVPD